MYGIVVYIGSRWLLQCCALVQLYWDVSVSEAGNTMRQIAVVRLRIPVITIVMLARYLYLYGVLIIHLLTGFPAALKMWSEKFPTTFLTPKEIHNSNGVTKQQKRYTTAMAGKFWKN